MLEFERTLPMLLLRSREATMGFIRPVLKRFGVTEQQWRVLRVLTQDSGLEATELAQRTLVLGPSLTGVIDRLTRDGLVERRKHKEDGRKVCVYITRKGRSLCTKVLPEIEAEYQVLQSQLNSQTWSALLQSLEAYLNSLEQRSAGLSAVAEEEDKS